MPATHSLKRIMPKLQLRFLKLNSIGFVYLYNPKSSHEGSHLDLRYYHPEPSPKIEPQSMDLRCLKYDPCRLN